MGFFFHSSKQDDNIDYEKLRRDIRSEHSTAALGFGSELEAFEAFRTDLADEKELLELARELGIDLRNYKK